MSALAPIRVLVVDDHPVSLLGLVALVGSQPGFEIAGEAGTVRDAVEAHRRIRPDVTLLDLRLPDGTALDALARIRAESPDARVVILTGVEGEEHAYRALKLGASGYLSKSGSTEDLVRALREVVAGGRAVAPEIARAIAIRVGQPDLTPRELEVLALLAAGRSNAEIGVALSMSTGTARTHVSRILEKLGAGDRTEAAAIAIRRGFL